MRFVFDCYHILIFEINGIYVSDFYIKLNIDKLFDVHNKKKFLDYKN